MIEFTHENGSNIVRLEVPGKLELRDMVLRTVSAACKLMIPDSRTRGSRYAEFATHFVSAVGEAYNNIVQHGYGGREPGSIQVQIENGPDWMRVMIKDTGVSFDPSQALPPDLDALPESGLGIFIMRSFVDEVIYVAGSPNVLTLVKHLDKGNESGSNKERLLVSKQG